MFFMRRAYGASKFEVIAVVALLGILVAVLLNRLSYYEELAEKAKMEYTASAIKSALRVQMSLMLIQGRTRDFALLAQQNPLDWLEQKTATDSELTINAKPDRTFSGKWEFDPISRTLVYWAKHAKYFEPDSTGQKRVRWQVKLTQDPSDGGANTGNRVVGAVLVLVEPYHWF